MKEGIVKHYAGRLGEFDYDTKYWEIWHRPAGMGMVDMLRYRGRTTDGSQVDIPYGVVDLSYTFEGSRLITPPSIPMTVRVMQYTFQNCKSLCRGVSLPDGVTRTGFMYQNCRNMVSGSDMPDSVTDASYMYDGCISLINPGRVSENLVNGAGMFRNCRSMSVIPELPDRIRRDSQVFRGCETIKTLLAEVV